MTARDPPAPEALPLGPAEREAVERACARARAAYGDLDLDAGRFRARVERHATRRGRTEDGRSDAALAAAWVRSAALVDLALATACDAGDARAWEALERGHRRRLEGFAVRRGLPPAQAESAVQDLLGDLALPAPRPGSRTLLGTYDGSGSLFGWLCVVLLRRIAAEARRRRPASLEAQHPGAIESARPAASGPPPADPSAAAGDAEALAAFDRAVAGAWARLTPRERVAVLFRHRDGLRQRRVADLLGIGEARVSRLISAGVAKLAAAAGVAPGAIGDGSPPPAFAAVLARRMARDPTEPPPSIGGTSPSER